MTNPIHIYFEDGLLAKIRFTYRVINNDELSDDAIEEIEDTFAVYGSHRLKQSYKYIAKKYKLFDDIVNSRERDILIYNNNILQ